MGQVLLFSSSLAMGWESPWPWPSLFLPSQMQPPGLGKPSLNLHQSKLLLPLEPQAPQQCGGSPTGLAGEGKARGGC